MKVDAVSGFSLWIPPIDNLERARRLKAERTKKSGSLSFAKMLAELIVANQQPVVKMSESEQRKLIMDKMPYKIFLAYLNHGEV